ncbi:SbcC/MukB-like Walker B domain-containing protein [Bradyrhizobium sp. ARR65]|uniref:SbcC/MukB-like Walker B domain-containing protein n=1 Tax=Bradyrhizobium sp. ARR65 TaxID=1040989 RepID=UPI0004651815|nr:SbcC/MukB-like Walker B domain-containing protein [Bradyrhizobium sp. ARR65]
MIELRRIILVDWYLFRAQQVDMRGMTAIIGPNGAGKSAIIDAVQTVLSGASMASIRFNPSAQSNVRSKRTLRDYCLGVVSLDEKGERSEPTRQHAYTYIILVFEDLDDGSAVSLGVAFSASASRSDESCEARFIAKDALNKDDILASVGDDEVETLQWHAVRNALRARNIEVDDAFSSATDFVAESLRALSPAGFPLDPRRFQRAFRNALLLKPVDNPTEFVRNYVLDVQPIQVDRLRRGIEHWRSLTRRIEELKAQSASLAGILRIVARAVENERVIAVANWQIARLEWEKFLRDARRQEENIAQLKSAAAKAEVEAVAASTRHSTIETELKAVELSINTSDGEQLALMYESDKNLTVGQRANAMAPVKEIDGLIASIRKAVDRNLLVRRDDLLHALLSAVVVARGRAPLSEWDKTLPEDWKDSASHLDAALVAVDQERLAAVRKTFSDVHFNARMAAKELQDRIDQIDSNLKRMDQGLSPIERGTRDLMDQLRSHGIEAEPLCDLVEIRDDKWRMAAEAVLGRSREALIVEPGRAVRALEIYREGGEYSFQHAEVINTTKTDTTRPAEKGSLAQIISTENRHARAFLNYRLGRLMMVETMDRMVAAENAITPDRMMQGGRTVRRLPKPEHLKLGRATQGQMRQQLERERAELAQKLAEQANEVLRLEEDASLFGDMFAQFQKVQAAGLSCLACGAALVEFDRRISDVEKNIEDARRNRDPKLIAERDRLRTEVVATASLKNTTQETFKGAQRARDRAEGAYEIYVRENRDTLSSARRGRARQLREGFPQSTAMRDYRVQVGAIATESIQNLVSGFAADRDRRSTERRSSLMREMTGAMNKHGQEFHVVPPFTAEEATPAAVEQWAAAEKQRLDTHELVQYEEQCRNAATEMTSAFRNDLLHRLDDAFTGIKATLNELNRHLKDRQFHGRDYYSFKALEAPTHVDMIDLVEESRKPDFNLPLFEDRSGDAGSPMMRAVRQIEEILSNPEARTEDIEDPRKYFNFELYIQDAAGVIRSSLTSRAGTGSGGEGQLPFYIAIGASLAATYQNRRTGESGLSLAIFDEAFNRLDTKAIGQCSEFMRDLGLQVMLATPDEKRHVFMEVVDTVVNVNRLGNQVMIDTEFLTDKARDAIVAIDPYRKGFDVFKSELIAAEKAEAVPRDQAAE